MLVIPVEFARGRIDRDSRVAVEVGRSRARGAVGIAAGAFEAGVRHRGRNSPVELFPDRVVSAGETPSGRAVGIHPTLSPTFRARLAWRRRGVEPPHFLAGQSVVRSDEAGVARSAAGASGDHLAV